MDSISDAYSVTELVATFPYSVVSKKMKLIHKIHVTFRWKRCLFDDMSLPLGIYLKACNLLFEEGILSKNRVTSISSPALMKMKSGYIYFSDWKKNLSTVVPGNSTDFLIIIL